MADKLQKKSATRRDREDALRLKLAGDPSHINAREDALLRETMPEAHGRVVTSGLLAEAGRRGDDRVTLLIPEEAALLKARGGAGTRNPASGLLEFYGDSPGTSGGGGGEGGDNGVGGPGNGSAGTGPGQGPGPGDAGYGGDYGGYSSGVGYGFSNYGTPAGLSYSDISNFGGIGAPGAGSIGPGGDMSNFAGSIGGLTAAGIEAGYAPKDTWMRVLQEYFTPSVKTSPYGRTTGMNLGIMGAAVGKLAGGPMSGLMGIGAAMGRAQSPAEQAASMAHNQALGAQNSTGQDRDSSTGLSFAELSARNVPGAESGSSTAGLLAQQTGAVGGVGGTSTTAPGAVPTVTPGGLMQTDERDNTLTGLPQPIQNLLSDYIWRGRQGTGFGW